MGRLLERDSELARLHGWLIEAVAGHGRIVFVGGEAGIGKTTLVGELARSAPAAVAGGRRPVRRAADARALGPFLEVASALGLDATADRDRLLGDAARRARDGRPDPGRRRGRALGRRRDASTCSPCSAGGPSTCRCCSSSPTATTRSPPSTRCGCVHRRSRRRPARRRGSGCRRCRCDAVRRAGRAGTASPADELHERTGGNPFFVTEALAAPGDDVPDDRPSGRAGPGGPARRRRPRPCSMPSPSCPVGPSRGSSPRCATSRPRRDRRLHRGGVLVADGRHVRVPSRARPAGRRGRADRRAAPARSTSGPSTRSPARRASTRPASPTTPRRPATSAALARCGHATRACVAAARTAHREAVRHGERALAVGHALTPDERGRLCRRGWRTSLMRLRPRRARRTRWPRDAVDHWRRSATTAGRPTRCVVLGQRAAQRRATRRRRWRRSSGPSRSSSGTRPARSCDGLRPPDVAPHAGPRPRRGRGRGASGRSRWPTELDDGRCSGGRSSRPGIADVMDGRFDGLWTASARASTSAGATTCPASSPSG